MKKFVFLAVIMVLAFGLSAQIVYRVQLQTNDISQKFKVYRNGIYMATTDGNNTVEVTSTNVNNLLGTWTIEDAPPGYDWAFGLVSHVVIKAYFTPSNSYSHLLVWNLYGDGPPSTPVELSSFTATITARNNVLLTWITQSETDMRGYYVYRATVNDLTEAMIVSPLIQSANSSQQQTYIFEDTELFESGLYYYWLQANDLDGSFSFHGPVNVLYDSSEEQTTPEIPLITQLNSSYPNPFNPMVFIPFSLAEDGAVSLKIYNSRGQMVKQFDLGLKTAGYHSISWDGTGYNGETLANGVYTIRMTTKNKTYQSKAALLK